MWCLVVFSNSDGSDIDEVWGPYSSADEAHKDEPRVRKELGCEIDEDWYCEVAELKAP